LVLVGFTAATFALANIRSASDTEQVKRNGIDVMVALDVSNSMLAQDINPNRLDRAKQVISKMVDRLSNDRVGIVIFAGKAYLQMPLTSDHGAAKLYLSAATPESVPTQGTVIGDALKMCYLSFNSKEKKYKAIVLLSDGEDHDEGAVESAKQMAADGVVIHTVGIGTVQGAAVPDVATGQLKKDNAGNIVVSALNEDVLKKVAEAGQGQYQLFSNTETVVSNIVSQLSTMDQRSVSDDSLINYKSFFQIFLGIAFLFLLIELFISEKRRRLAEGKLKPVIASLVMIFISISADAQDDKKLIKEGNEAYKNRQYEKAAAAYEKAARENAESQEAIYNLGSALYKNGDSAKAISAYDMAIKSAKDPLDKSNAHYNKGVIYQNSNKLPECIEEYKRALRINPNDEDARHNLQKALQKQKEQQKNKQDQKNNSSNNNNKSNQQRSKMSQEDAKNKLEALQREEKNLHDKLKKVNANATNKPEKDW
jgi:Ca-activated chloride channel family protein